MALLVAVSSIVSAQGAGLSIPGRCGVDNIALHLGGLRYTHSKCPVGCPDLCQDFDHNVCPPNDPCCCSACDGPSYPVEGVCPDGTAADQPLPLPLPPVACAAPQGCAFPEATEHDCGPMVCDHPPPDWDCVKHKCAEELEACEAMPRCNGMAQKAMSGAEISEAEIEGLKLGDAAAFKAFVAGKQCSESKCVTKPAPPPMLMCPAGVGAPAFSEPVRFPEFEPAVLPNLVLSGYYCDNGYGRGTTPVHSNPLFNQVYQPVGNTRDGRPYYRGVTDPSVYIHYDAACGLSCANDEGTGQHKPRWIVSQPGPSPAFPVLAAQRDFYIERFRDGGCRNDLSFLNDADEHHDDGDYLPPDWDCVKHKCAEELEACEAMPRCNGMTQKAMSGAEISEAEIEGLKLGDAAAFKAFVAGKQCSESKCVTKPAPGPGSMLPPIGTRYHHHQWCRDHSVGAEITLGVESVGRSVQRAIDEQVHAALTFVEAKQRHQLAREAAIFVEVGRLLMATAGADDAAALAPPAHIRGRPLAGTA